MCNLTFAFATLHTFVLEYSHDPYMFPIRLGFICLQVKVCLYVHILVIISRLIHSYNCSCTCLYAINCPLTNTFPHDTVWLDEWPTIHDRRLTDWQMADFVIAGGLLTILIYRLLIHLTKTMINIQSNWTCNIGISHASLP